MKLNYKKTILVGFAFFLICAFWQAYDAIVPIMLVNKFGLNQTWSGVIMALDNILALFMLPLFGALSDKKHTKYGKRTPFIFIGTLCAVICFTAMSFVDYQQLKNNLGYGTVKVGSIEEAQLLWDANPEIRISNAKNADDIFGQLFSGTTQESLHDYVSDMKYYTDAETAYNEALEAFIKGESKVNPVKFIGMIEHRSYSEWRDYYTMMNKFAETKDKSLLSEDYGFITVKDKDDFLGISFKIPKASVLLSEPYLSMEKTELNNLYGSENDPIAKSMSLNSYYTDYIAASRSAYALDATLLNPLYLIIFVVLLLMTLISMASFRSPAVALMPDVTLKPLRSKANAIINLMGTAGGMLVLGLGIVFKTTDASNALMNYTPFVVCVCLIMLIALAIFIWKVKENKLVHEMQEEAKQYGIIDQTTDEESELSGNNKLDKSQKLSLGLILASVALWFIGYNAITSKYSLYATNILDKDYNLTLLLAQAAAIVSYIPVGIISTKFGRRRTIMAGIIMLTVAFTGGALITSESSSIIMYALFMLAGIAWATINVNSFPMVVELAKGSNVGKYTGYYYTASMAAQIATPIFSGVLMDQLGMRILFPYGAIFVGLAFITMFFVKHGDAQVIEEKQNV